MDKELERRGKKIKSEDLILDDMAGLLTTFDEMSNDVLPVFMDAARKFEESQLDAAFLKKPLKDQ